MANVLLCLRMATYMKDKCLIIKEMEKALILMLIMVGIKEISNMIKKMAREYRFFIINQHIKANL